jgi:hypothetical protein
MKHHRSISLPVLLLAAMSPAWAQMMSSHASSATAKPSTDGSMLATTALQPVGKAVARVNGAVLTDRDLVREEYTIFPYARQHNGIPTAMAADIRAGAMKMMEFEELVYQEAERRKMTVPPAKLQRAVSDFRKQFANPQDYQDLVQREFKGSKQLLEARIERSLLIDEMLKIEIEDPSEISVAQAHAYYDKNPDKFRFPESYAIQTISIIPPDNATPEQQKEARKNAENALKQAQATKNYEDFGVLAERISQDDYRVMMGDHRALDAAKIPPAVLNAVSAMQPGQISGLLELENHAYTIVRLNGHTPAGIRKFEDVKDSLREYLKKQKTEELRRALDARLRKHAKVEEL